MSNEDDVHDEEHDKLLDAEEQVRDACIELMRAFPDIVKVSCDNEGNVKTSTDVSINPC